MIELPLYITSLAASILGLIFILQTFSVVGARFSHRAPFGLAEDGQSRTLMKRVRGHGNMAEQMPLFLIMLGLIEFQDLASFSTMLIIAAIFIGGRIAHAFYFLDIGAHWMFRRWGMIFTAVAQIAALATLFLGLVS